MCEIIRDRDHCDPINGDVYMFMSGGRDNEQIKRFALFLFEENQKKSKQFDEICLFQKPRH